MPVVRCSTRQDCVEYAAEICCRNAEVRVLQPVRVPMTVIDFAMS